MRRKPGDIADGQTWGRMQSDISNKAKRHIRFPSCGSLLVGMQFPLPLEAMRRSMTT